MEELTNHSEEVTQETTQVETQQDTTQVENTTQQTEQTTEAQTPQSLKVKYNHQEIELPYEEAITHIQKGMNYEKAVERASQEAAQKARDAFIAEMGYEWKGKPITNEAEYKRAVQEQQIEEALKQQYANVPDEIVNELIEGRRFREETQAERKAREEQEKQAKERQDLETRKTAMYDEFFSEFPDYNSQEKWKEIPKEVWADAEKWLESVGREGRRMADAMAWYNLKQLRTQQQAAQVNQANAETSPGSVTGNGSTGNDFISFQAFEANKNDPEWVRKNFTKINESRAKW